MSLTWKQSIGSWKHDQSERLGGALRSASLGLSPRSSFLTQTTRHLLQSGKLAWQRNGPKRRRVKRPPREMMHVERKTTRSARVGTPRRH